MSRAAVAPEALRSNAFAVVGLTPSASRRELESAAERLLAQIEIGVGSACSYPCPATGEPQRRDTEILREARRRLREPGLRAREELWWLVAVAWSHAS